MDGRLAMAPKVAVHPTSLFTEFRPSLAFSGLPILGDFALFIPVSSDSVPAT